MSTSAFTSSIELLALPSGSVERTYHLLIKIDSSGQVLLADASRQKELTSELPAEETEAVFSHIQQSGLLEVDSHELQRVIEANSQQAETTSSLKPISAVADGGEFLLRFDTSGQRHELKLSNPDYIAAAQPSLREVTRFCQLKRMLLEIRAKLLQE